MTTHSDDGPASGDAILRAFASAGLRNTKPRRVIAHTLAEHAAEETDFGAEELWRQLQDHEARPGRATLFRSIDILSELGILDRIELADGAVRYRVCGSEHHHHLICNRCRHIQEVNVCLSQTQLDDVAAATGFTVDRHVLEVYGLCADCKVTAA